MNKPFRKDKIVFIAYMKTKVKEMHDKRSDINFDMQNNFDRMNNRFKRIQKVKIRQISLAKICYPL